jgi:hypothetical protein
MNFKITSRLLIAIIVATVGSAIAPTKSFAATTANVPLSGSVASTLDITAAPEAGASALDLSAGEKTVKVATLSIQTNNSTGYTLTVNDGVLAKAAPDAAVTPIAYQVNTANAGAAAPTTFTAGNHTFNSGVANAAGAGNRDLYIRYTPEALQDPGTYTATVTMTVADN